MWFQFKPYVPVAKRRAQAAKEVEKRRKKGANVSPGVIEVVTAKDGGLFPKPRQIDKRCSCPDWANLCKHLAAVLYGVGARLDSRPELLFVLRKVDHLELIEEATSRAAAAKPVKTG